MGINKLQLHNNTVYSHKQGRIIKKPNVKVYILDDFIYMKFKSRQKLIKVSEVRVAFTLGGLMNESEKNTPLGCW